MDSESIGNVVGCLRSIWTHADMPGERAVNIAAAYHAACKPSALIFISLRVRNRAADVMELDRLNLSLRSSPMLTAN